MRDWAVASLGSLASFTKGRKVTTAAHADAGYLPYLGASAISGMINEYADPRGGVLAADQDVLMLWDGERSGLVGKGQAGVVSSTMMRLRPLSVVTGSYLYFALSNQFEWIQNRRTGTGVPHVPKDLGRILRLDFPTSRLEQDRISEALSTLDSAIERTEVLITKGRVVKTGLMHDFLTRGVLPDGSLRPSPTAAPRLYNETPIGPLPTGWNCLPLEKLLAGVPHAMRSGPFGSALLKAELVEEGIPFLGIDNIFPERFAANYRRFLSREKYLSLARYAVRPADVIITIMGTVGRCCLAPDDLGDALSSKHLWTMTFDREKALPDLICWQLNHAAWVKRWFERHAQGAVMDAIQSSTLKTLHLPVPPLAEQEIIRERYRALSSAISVEEANLEKLRQQRQGLMRDLLAGRVRLEARAA